MMKKIKEWVKEHEVTVMLIGSAIVGGAAVIAGQKLVTKLLPGPEHVDINIGHAQLHGAPKIGISMTEVFKSGKEGDAVLAFWKLEDAAKIAEAITSEIAEVTGEAS